MKRLILFLNVFFIATSAYGAKIIGNGADVLVCKDGRPPMLYDFWEAMDLTRVTLWNPGGNTYKEKVHSFTTRIAKHFPVLARTIEADFVLFEEKKSVKYGRQWDDIKDTFPREKYPLQKPEEVYHGNLPNGCNVTQMANQRPPLFPRHPWFLLNGELWESQFDADKLKALDEFNKAGVAVHEIIYRQGLSYGLTDSLGVRYLVGLLFSDELDSVSDGDWIAGFLQSNIKYYEIGGFRFPLFSGNPDNCEFAKAAGFARAVGPECQSSSPIRQARIKIDNEVLKAINYDVNEQMDLFTPLAVASIETRAARFDQEGGNVSVLIQGVMTVSSIDRSGNSVKYEIDGKIVPNEGSFCGKRASLDGMESGRPRLFQPYCGPVDGMLKRTDPGGGAP